MNETPKKPKFKLFIQPRKWLTRFTGLPIVLAAMADVAGVVHDPQLQLIFLGSMFVTGVMSPDPANALDDHVKTIKDDLHREVVKAEIKKYADRYRTTRRLRTRHDGRRQD